MGFLWSLVLGAWSFTAQAVLPEPDNVIFGAISRGGASVTAADYDVIVEIRRAPGGPAIATYQMGSNPRLGDFYSVRVPLESLTPTVSPDATQGGDLLYLVVTDYNGAFATTNLVVGQRGTFQRVNLGDAINPDADGDGLPDAWETANGITGNGSGDRDGDGFTDRSEYLAGTNPNDANDALRVSITLLNQQRQVSFFARRAEGTGYEGRQRLYSLEFTTNLTLSPWSGVANYTNLLGNSQTILYLAPSTNAPTFYRGKAWLQGP